MSRILVLFIFFLFTSCQIENPNHLLVAVASSATYPVKEIKAEFEKRYSDKVTLIFGSSGKFTAQIEQGSPVDIFISADMKYPQYLFERKKTIGAPIQYATGQLAIFKRKTDKQSSFEQDILNPEIKHIAIANPEIAPYGALTINYLKSRDILSKVEKKLVFGDNVSQTIQFVLSGNADIGISALSVLKNPLLDNKLTYQLIENQASLDHSFVLIQSNSNANHKLKENFALFLQSDFAQEVFAKYGLL